MTMTVTAATWEMIAAALGAVGVTVIVWVFCDGIARLVERAFR